MLVLLGVNHRSAPVDVRERLAVPSSTLPDRLRELAERDGIRAAYWLSTCNRVELLVEADSRRDAVRSLEDTLSGISDLSVDRLERYLYRKIGGGVARHLFRVTSGLDSMILGEPQIAGQVRDAYRTARDAGTLSSTLERLLQKALSTSKTVRTQTGISRHPVSVASTAVELARTIFGDLSERSALLLGAGKMSALMGEHLKGRGIARLHVASRRFSTAERLAGTLAGRPMRWDDAIESLGDIDVLVSGTAAMSRVLEVEHVQRAVRKRRGRPLLIVDIGVPRDVHPDVNALDNVYLYDIDALQSVVDRGLEERRRAAQEAETRIDRAVEGWERWVRSNEMAPTIAALSDAWHRIARAELERHRRRLGPLDPEQEQAVRELARGLVKKLLHHPIHALRTDSELAPTWDAERLKRLFGLERGEARSEDDETSIGPSHALDGGKDA